MSELRRCDGRANVRPGSKQRLRGRSERRRRWTARSKPGLSRYRAVRRTGRRRRGSLRHRDGRASQDLRIRRGRRRDPGLVRASPQTSSQSRAGTRNGICIASSAQLRRGLAKGWRHRCPPFMIRTTLGRRPGRGLPSRTQTNSLPLADPRLRPSRQTRRPIHPLSRQRSHRLVRQS